MAPRRSKRSGVQKKSKSKLQKLVTRAVAKQVRRMIPDLYTEKSHSGWINGDNDFDEAFALFQAPFQDINLQLSTGEPSKNQRTDAVIRLQRLHFGGMFQRAEDQPSGYKEESQALRIMVVYIRGEADHAVDNSQLHGWDPDNNQWTHAVKPGQLMLTKPFVRDQYVVLYDRTYRFENAYVIGKWIEFQVNLGNRKMTFETVGEGANAVGNGQVYIQITSTAPYRLGDYYTTGVYKDMQ